MRVSASQFDTFLLCPRKHYGQKVIKLPEIPGAHFEYGTVLHEVAERYLGSTLSGRVPEKPTGALAGQVPGETTNLYPDGWQRDLSYGEAEHINKTITYAIENGILVRKPGAFVEMEFSARFVDDIDIIGYLDYAYTWGVEDHKTTKNLRYAATDETIKDKLPMRLYAWALAETLPGDAPSEIYIKHNIFRKDAVDVRVAEAALDIVEIYEYVDFLRDTALVMKTIQEDAKPFLEVEGPTSKNACTAFGGCAFQKICGRQLTVEQYEKQFSSLELDKPKGPKGIFGALPKADMGKLEERLARFKAAKAEETAPTTEETEVEYPAPPWAYSSCTACDGIGWNSKKNPCKICQNMTKVDAGSMTMTPIDSESIQWSDGKDSGICTAPHGGLPAASKPEPTPIAPEPPATISEAPRSVPAADIAEAPEPEPESKIVPGKGFTLAIGCLPVKGATDVQQFDELFAGLVKQFEEDTGKGYYASNAFDRRDILASVAEGVAESLGDCVLYANPVYTDQKAFVEALRPFAAVIFEKVGE